jgi:hypothetical protein
MRGLHLHEARSTTKPTKVSHGWFGWWPRHDIQGGGRSTAGERRRYARLERNRKRVGVACSPHGKEVARVLGDGEAATGEVDADRPRWVTTAVSSVEDEFDPVNQN